MVQLKPPLGIQKIRFTPGPLLRRHGNPTQKVGHLNYSMSSELSLPLRALGAGLDDSCRLVSQSKIAALHTAKSATRRGSPFCGGGMGERAASPDPETGSGNIRLLS